MSPPPADGLASRLFLAPALRAQPDRRLVTLVRDGYDAAFEEIVRRYQGTLGRYAAKIVGNRSEDVTQDAFSKALLALRRDAEAEIELRPWLYRIVRNTALNDLRDRPPEDVELVEAYTGGSHSAAEEAERREEMSDLLTRLQALPDSQRAAIVMRELEGLGHDEIAAALGMSGGGARQAIFRARQALRDGVGLMIPLPALRMLIDHGAEAGAAAGAGGAAAAIGGAGGGAAVKIGLVTAVLAGSVGTGVAIDQGGSHDGDRGDTAAAATVPTGAESAATAGFGAASDDDGSMAGEDRSGPGGEDRSGRDGSRHGEDTSGHHESSRGPGSGEDSSGHDGLVSGGSGPGGGDDLSGGSSGPGGGTDTSGASGSGSSGSGSGSSGSASGSTSGSGSGSSGPGSGSSGSGSGTSGSGSSGSGSGSSGSGETTEPLPELDSSGPGSGSLDSTVDDGGHSGPG